MKYVGRNSGLQSVRSWEVLGVLLGLLLFGAPLAHAATFTVTKTADTNDGACDADCSLREAINAANASPGPDTIDFHPSVTGTITLSGPLPHVTGNLTITGPGAATLSVDANQTGNVLVVDNYATAAIGGLTLTGGSSTGVLNNNYAKLTLTGVVISGNSDVNGGGGIATEGNSTLTVVDSTVRGNHANWGGGISAFHANVTTTSSTVSGNAAASSAGGITSASGTLKLTNVTVSSNTVSGGPGGGVHSTGATVLLTNVTVTGNSTSGTGGGVYSSGGTTKLANTIVAGNTGNSECGGAGPYTSLGHNLLGPSCSIPLAAGDLAGMNPMLGLLQNNGGPTKTHALLAGSPAINAGDNVGCPGTDQRGVARPQGAACDIGAYEAISMPTPTRTATPTFTATKTRTFTPTRTPTRTPTSPPTLTATRTIPPTQTRTFTPTSSPTRTPTKTLTPTSTPIPCVGDCDGDGVVTVNELIVMVNIALGNLSPSACTAGDADHDGTITINEIIAAVNNALNGCPCGFIGPRMCGGRCPNSTDVCQPLPDDSGCVCRPGGLSPTSTATSPRPPTPTATPTCAEGRSLLVSTGNASIGGNDPIWSLTGAPVGIANFPPARPAIVIGAYGGWSTLTNTQWITADSVCGHTTGCPGGTYEYELCWQQCGELVDVTPFMALADNRANVFLDNAFLIAVPGFSVPTSFSFNAGPGPHSLRVDVVNDLFSGSQTPTGMDLSGVLTGQIQIVQCPVRAPTFTATPSATPSRTPTKTPTRTATPAGMPTTCVPTPGGMIAWWKLNEPPGAGTVVDIGLPPANNGVPRPGLLVGPPGFPQAVSGNLVTNPPDGALFFDVPTTYVEVPSSNPSTNDLNLANSDLTMDAWIKPTEVHPVLAGVVDVVEPIVDKLGSGNTKGYALYLQITGTCPTCPPSPHAAPPGTVQDVEMHLVFAVGNGISTSSYPSNSIYTGTFTVAAVPPLSKPWPDWMHLTVEVDRTSNMGTFYLNGSHLDSLDPIGNPVGSFSPVTGVDDSSASFWIGGTRLFPNPFGIHGEITINELEVFNVPLSPGDIQSIATSPGGKCNDASPPATATATFSPTGPPPATATRTPTASFTATPRPSNTPTRTPTPSFTRTPPATATRTPTASSTATRSTTPTATAATSTPTRTRTATPTPTPTRTATIRSEICGIKFNDLNGNGMYEPLLGESGLGPWTINLVFGTPPNVVDLQATTDASGNYCFTGLAPGTYHVSETLLPGWIQTFPALPGTYTVIVPPSVTNINFGNKLAPTPTPTPTPTAGGCALASGSSPPMCTGACPAGDVCSFVPGYCCSQLQCFNIPCQGPLDCGARETCSATCACVTPTPDPCASHPDGTTCDAGTDGTPTKIFIGGTCVACTAAPSASPRFVDNCNGTITDRQTCLVWEKKDDAGGLHDKDNTYQWSSTGTAPDGNAFTVFIAGLNSAGFAGHHDWRLPKEDGQNGSGPNELETILAAPYWCNVGPPCVDAAFNTNCGLYSGGNAGCTVDGAASTQECSCTQSNGYWSATTYAGPGSAWLVNFDGGFVFGDNKTVINGYYGRAVRSGL